jgi:hypothetical protein
MITEHSSHEPERAGQGVTNTQCAPGNHDGMPRSREGQGRSRWVRLFVFTATIAALLCISSTLTMAKRPLRQTRQTQANAKSTAPDTSEEFEWTVEHGCTGTDGCSYWHAAGEPYFPQTPVIASPAGSTYSVHHMIHGDPDGPGPQPLQCIPIFNPLLPGAPDDVVLFDGLPESIRADLFGTVPTVTERAIANPNGTFQVIVETSSPEETDLFPDRFVDSQGNPLRNICFSIGMDDPLDWAGTDTALAAFIEFRRDSDLLIGPLNITQFVTPWNGAFNVIVQNAAGLGINRVRLEVLIEKDVPPPPNDFCDDAVPLPNGTIAFSNVGAQFQPDGPDEPEMCDFNGSSQIGSDIWYRYTATCTGDLFIDTCSNTFFDSKIAVYPGCTSCPPLVEPLACSDDAPFCGPFGEQARVDLPVTQGQCYTVRVGGFLGDQGPGVMRVSCRIGACCNQGACTDGLNRISCEEGGGTWFPNSSCSNVTCPAVPPPNDLCDDCVVLTTGVPFESSTSGAGGADESSCGGINDTTDVWACWTAECTGTATFDLCNAFFDTTLAVFDECGGNELACNDDACGLNGTRSRISMLVEEGMTYRIRVAGFGGASGNFTLVVNECAPPSGACCVAGFSQLCFPEQSEAGCIDFGGTYLGDGSGCMGDMNGNFADDACETCLAATIISEAAPLDGTVDARQPHPATADLPLQGIGSPDDPIVLRLNPRIIGAADCFDVCETVIDVEKGPNSVATVTSLGSGFYEIVLDRPITAPGVTTIRYTGDNSFVEYIAHPANVNADATADVNDLVHLIDCCIFGLCTPAHGRFSCDLDHSGTWAPPDVMAAIDLLNGGGAFSAALDTPLPSNENICP